MAEGDAATAAYMGHWLRLGGTLDSILAHALPSADGRHHHIVALAEYVGDGAPVVVLWFDSRRWALRLTMLGKGTPVTVLGRVTGLSHHTVQLRDCELL
jgi:hypothetical protein